MLVSGIVGVCNRKWASATTAVEFTKTRPMSLMKDIEVIDAAKQIEIVNWSDSVHITDRVYCGVVHNWAFDGSATRDIRQGYRTAKSVVPSWLWSITGLWHLSLSASVGHFQFGAAGYNRMKPYVNTWRAGERPPFNMVSFTRKA
jgi:hypothetical protein